MSSRDLTKDDTKMKVLQHISACLVLLLLAGCAKDGVQAPVRTFGGPAEVTLVLSGGESTTKAAVDESSPVKTIRIYAFKHAPEDPVQHNENVGYAMYSGLEGSGPHYCHLYLDVSGDIDFYVIANDMYAVSGNTLDENSTREEIEGFRFTGREIVYDIIYKPKMTKLLSEAAAAGCTLHYGEEMLLEQGKLQFEMFTGYHYPRGIGE